MSKKEIVQKSFQILAGILGFAIFIGTSLDDSDDVIHDVFDVYEKERIYNREKPDTINYTRSLSSEEAKLVNVMSDFLDQGIYKTFPHYIRGQSYKEFDSEILQILNQQIELLKEADEKNDRREKQKSRLWTWGGVAIMALLFLGGFLSSLIKESDKGSEKSSSDP